VSGLKLEGLTKKYPNGLLAVQNFDLDIKDKEFIIFVGPSGCGKSTTLRMIAGLEEISDGDLYIDGERMNDVAPKDRNIAMVFQDYALYPNMTVFDNMAFALKLRKLPKAEIKLRVTEAAKKLDIEHLLDRKPKALSGGQRQRVAMGRTIERQPKIFHMDEHTAYLDAIRRSQMRIEIAKMHKTLQTTFVYVTHDQIEALTLGTRIVVLKDGIIQQVDSPQNLYDKPCNLFVAGFIGSPQMNFFNATAAKEGDEIFVKIGKYNIKLSKEKAEKVEQGGYIGKEVVVGVRPEDLHDEEVFINVSDNVITAGVSVVEMLGAEKNLYITIEGHNAIARVSPRSTSKENEDIKIAFDTNKLHIFDKETETTITN